MWPCWLLVWMNMMSWGEGPGYKLHNYEFWWDFRITIIISGIRESVRPTAMDTCWRYIYDFVRTLIHSWLEPRILLVTTHNSWFSKSNIRNIIPLVSHSPIIYSYLPVCPIVSVVFRIIPCIPGIYQLQKSFHIPPDWYAWASLVSAYTTSPTCIT